METAAQKENTGKKLEALKTVRHGLMLHDKLWKGRYV